MVATITAVRPGPAGAEPLGGYPDLPEWAEAVLDRLVLSSTDAMRGMVVMMMPAGDPYSVRQGVTANGPGPLDQNAPESFVNLVDRFIPQGDQLLRPVAVALSTTLVDLTGGVPGALPDAERARVIDEAIGYRFNDRTFPATLLAGLLLDVGALLVDVRSIDGPFASAFANSTYTSKCRVMELIESPLPLLVSLIDDALPQPLAGSASGVLKFLGGILLDGAAFTAWSEHELYDRHTRTLSARPIAWDITGYRPNGLVDGHDEFIGFHKGMNAF